MLLQAWGYTNTFKLACFRIWKSSITDINNLYCGGVRERGEAEEKLGLLEEYQMVVEMIVITALSKWY